ncbi:MAG: hypothetical protein AAF773_10255 [Cyanobacteria bacterium P01_D01_bin.115]
MNTMLWFGIMGFTIVISLNAIALLASTSATARFFSTDWWSVWFPIYLVWFIFAVTGLGIKLSP